MQHKIHKLIHTIDFWQRCKGHSIQIGKSSTNVVEKLGISTGGKKKKYLDQIFTPITKKLMNNR